MGPLCMGFVNIIDDSLQLLVGSNDLSIHPYSIILLPVPSNDKTQHTTNCAQNNWEAVYIAAVIPVAPFTNTD